MDQNCSSRKIYLSPGGSTVCSVPTEIAAAERARWLAELSCALRDAQRLLFELDLETAVAPDAGELFQAIEAAQIEIRSLQLSRHARQAK